MREIKFRGKSLEGDWVYGLPQQETTLSHTISFINQYFGEQRKYGRFTVSIIAETLGQFTGLKDINGIEIYEGDIIKSVLEDRRSINPIDKILIGVVEWDNEMSGYCFGRDDDTVEFGLAYALNDSTVVIGNIHENPELLT